MLPMNAFLGVAMAHDLFEHLARERQRASGGRSTSQHRGEQRQPYDLKDPVIAEVDELLVLKALRMVVSELQ